jgi:hypothetical protein
MSITSNSGVWASLGVISLNSLFWWFGHFFYFA